VTGIQLGQAGEVTLRWTAVAGRGYRVEAAAALASDPWRNAGQVTATGPEAAFTDTGHNGAPAQYYRIVLLP
jgi:hypothetical protein